MVQSRSAALKRDLYLCVELSVPSGGTNKYFADIPRSICLKDCTGAGCTRVTNPSTKFYGDLSTCCSQGLPWTSQEFCNTRSVQQTSNKWFASPDHTCRQDCVSGATCANLTDSTETLYATALECCQTELSFMPEDKCNTLSLGNPLTGSSKWFVSYKADGERCYQDCPEGTGNCGGLADPDVQLFDNSTACCQTKLPHKRLAYCEAVSAGNQWAGSGEFYPGMLLNSEMIHDINAHTHDHIVIPKKTISQAHVSLTVTELRLVVEVLSQIPLSDYLLQPQSVVSKLCPLLILLCVKIDPA